MGDSLKLSDVAELRWLQESTEADKERSDAERIRERLSEDRKRAGYEEDNRKRRRKMLMEQYGWKLVDSHGPRRHEVARRAAKEITNREDRLWLAKRVMDASKAVGWKKRKDAAKKGFVRKFGEKLYELPQAISEGAIDIGESYAGLGRVIGGGDKDQGELKFQQLLEAAYQSGDPKNQNKDNIAWRTLRGSAKLSPQIALGAQAYNVAGKAGLATQAGTQMLAPIRERLVSEGVEPRSATAIATLAAGVSGVIETAVPIPGFGKGGLAATGKKIADKATAKLASEGGKKAIGTASQFGAEYLGEVGEEFAQAAVESIASLSGAALEGETEGRSLAEVPQEALAGSREAALPLLPISLFGGGLHIAGQIQSAKAREQIQKFASENKAPSRKEWKRLGLPAERGVTRKDRLAAVKEMAEVWAKTSETPATEQRVAPPGSETEEAGLRQEVADFLAEESGAKQVKVYQDQVAGLVGKEATEVMKSPNLEFERRREAAHGLSQKTPGFWARQADKIKSLWHAATRVQINLPKELVTANEVWRLRRNAPNAGLDEAVRQAAGITQELGPTQLELFERYLVTRNQLRSLYMEDAEPLRLGFESVEEVEQYESRLAAIVEATPEVKQAIQARQEMVGRLTERLVSEELLSESALEDVDSYVHQQVLLYRNAYRRSLGGTTLSKKKTFQKKRVKGAESLGEEFDYNTSYLEPEIAWMADAHTALANKQYSGKLVEEYNKAKEFTEQAKEKESTLRAVAEKEGYRIISRKSLFGTAVSIQDHVMEEFKQAIAEDLDLSDGELELMDGGENSEILAFPKEIVDQLEDDAQAPKAHWLTQINADMVNAWKAWTLMNPKRIIGYNLRNISGDLDPMLAAEPRALLEILPALRELKQFHFTNESLTDDLRASRDYGVINSGFAGTEVQKFGDMPLFKRFKKGAARYNANPVTAYMRVAKTGTEFRENILRHAAFKHYLRLVKEGRLDHFGASRAVAVKEIQRRFGDEAAAAHLSRNLLGDYGNMTVMGDYFRKHLFPFWSFVEINAKRYPRILENAFRAGKGRTATGAVLAKIAVARIGMMYGMLWAWNNLLIPAVTGEDDERDLPPYDRANPHVLLGRNSDGTVKVFRNVGALGDLLEWFGVNEAIAMLPKAKNGQIDWKDIGKESLKAPIEKFVGLLRPEAKTSFEVLTGKSLFPTPFEPRSIDRGEATANTLGLAEEYKQIKGALTETGDRARPHYLQRYLHGVVDPRVTALSEIYDLRNSYLEQQGAPEKGSYPISEYKPAREAAINDNKAAFLEWKRAFVERHRFTSLRKFTGYLQRVDPIAARLNEADEWKFEYQYLTNEQREKLRIAREYAAELRDRMVLWWTEPKSN